MRYLAGRTGRMRHILDEVRTAQVPKECTSRWCVAPYSFYGEGKRCKHLLLIYSLCRKWYRTSMTSRFVPLEVFEADHVPDIPDCERCQYILWKSKNHSN